MIQFEWKRLFQQSSKTRRSFVSPLTQTIRLTFRNWFYFIAGMAFMTLAKVKFIIKGYSSPKPFSISEYDKCAEYDIRVVDRWMDHLRKYAGNDAGDIVQNKTILELGPGSDLGIGLYLLSKGIKQYIAVDINNLAESVPHEFYKKLFNKISSIDNNADIRLLNEQLVKTQNKNNDRLNYVCRDDFDIAKAVGLSTIDIIFSQAAFEHFDDVDETVQKLSQITRAGTVIVAEIDLKTHTRWIRDKDPNNIYRYPKWFYRLFGFRGMPNRTRPSQYRDYFEKHGWSNITITPLNLLPTEYLEETKSSLSEEFRGLDKQMDCLSVLLCATRSKSSVMIAQSLPVACRPDI